VLDMMTHPMLAAGHPEPASSQYSCYDPAKHASNICQASLEPGNPELHRMPVAVRATPTLGLVGRKWIFFGTFGLKYPCI
jgi:hypothetical protein